MLVANILQMALIQVAKARAEQDVCSLPDLALRCMPASKAAWCCSACMPRMQLGAALQGSKAMFTVLLTCGCRRRKRRNTRGRTAHHLEANQVIISTAFHAGSAQPSLSAFTSVNSKHSVIVITRTPADDRMSHPAVQVQVTCRIPPSLV